MDIVLYSAIAWFIAQVMKVISVYQRTKKISLEAFFASGGFPSAHSAFVTCLMVQIGFLEGFRTSLFALALGLWAVVIYDSFNVRYAVGLQGEAINEMRKELVPELGPNYKPLKVIMGHTPFQVLAGIFLGLVLGIIRIYFIPFIITRGSFH